jgi:hypothetical protein
VGTGRSCAPLGEIGERCDGFDACAAGLLCDYAEVPSRCAAAPGPGELCPLATCTADSTCVDGTCVLRAGGGEACAATFQGCVEGFACDLGSGRCAPLGGVGDVCLGDERACGEGLLCDPFGPSSNLCIEPRGDGEACDFVIGVCAEGLYCGADGCEPVVPPGEPCSSFEACGPGASCVGFVCEPLPAAVGESCFAVCGGGLRCADDPGVCAAGVCALAEVPPAEPG